MTSTTGDSLPALKANIEPLEFVIWQEGTRDGLRKNGMLHLVEGPTAEERIPKPTITGLLAEQLERLRTAFGKDPTDTDLQEAVGKAYIARCEARDAEVAKTKAKDAELDQKALGALRVALDSGLRMKYDGISTAKALWEKLDNDHLTESPMASVNAKQMLTNFKWDSSKTANDNLRMLEIVIKLGHRVGEHKSTKEAFTVVAYFSGTPASFDMEIRDLMEALGRKESWNEQGEPKLHEGHPAPTIDWLREKLQRVEMRDRLTKSQSTPSTVTLPPVPQQGTAHYAPSYPPTYGTPYGYYGFMATRPRGGGGGGPMRGRGGGIPRGGGRGGGNFANPNMSPIGAVRPPFGAPNTSRPTDKPGPYDKPAYRCNNQSCANKTDHRTKDCRHLPCFNCKGTGHTRSECPHPQRTTMSLHPTALANLAMLQMQMGFDPMAQFFYEQSMYAHARPSETWL